MKIKKPVPEKPVREPRIDCRQTNYSETALAMMEQATGRHFAREVVAVKLETPAVDATPAEVAKQSAA
jgi:hypothetical protein